MWIKCLTGNSLVCRGGLQSLSVPGYPFTCHLACGSCLYVHILSLLQALYLSFTLYLFLSFFWVQQGREGGKKTYRSSVTFAALTASGRGGRVEEQTACGTRKRQTRMLKFLWKLLQWLHLFGWCLWLAIIWCGLKCRGIEDRHHLDLSILRRKRTASYPLHRKEPGRQQDRVLLPVLLFSWFFSLAASMSFL